MLSFVSDLRLVDHHCHGVLRDDVDRAGFEGMLTEADRTSPLGTSLFDSSIGLAVRRWCSPVLDLPPHAPADEYLARRRSLGAADVNRAFLMAADVDTYLVDGGLSPDLLLDHRELAAVTGAVSFEVVRLEYLAEQVVSAGCTASGFADAVRARLDSSTAVGAKSIAAYRVGLALRPERPTAKEVADAAGRWLASGGRCADEVLTRFLVWEALDRRLPVQFHVGYGDSDADLHRCDPLLLTDLLRATAGLGVPIMLLHNYPFHRNAGYLAQVFPHVFVDLGLTTHNVGHQASRLLAEALEIVPFGKFLFSTDAYGLAELYHLGVLLFRRALSDFLTAAMASGDVVEADAIRIAHLIGYENARRAYRLD
ncbi:amidohydrolase family protein [Umezawaea endophytica]|uniref:Amidohydrolase family protein n=1 Tax=Umezawaea endophytica TaxID=1654476 RepID=A0A9X2VL11_9PSEU|nr:amidohydrolase family protein [Umezawaea endophytica]MCS7478369.1 amidohydrolase family protein [Umezawaea endophytica]